ncbi:hypothetical protein HF086_016788 [Spodoptera exigua]|uniref:SANT domain-containing protein n=1 Tax=Spodoptera exigua TaxID=7107 RepID=A0A922SIP5_SPOEX|nr:hypothetical protein HF086_016788 [Spodoptera exigua]
MPKALWSTDEKNLFFEALNEYGKDFDAITAYICAKMKKKGMPDVNLKTKTQVSHFYYRTWHKLSKHVHFDEKRACGARVCSRAQVVLRARDAASWARVQAAAHNPRAALSTPLRARLHALIRALQHRWRETLVTDNEDADPLSSLAPPIVPLGLRFG